MQQAVIREEHDAEWKAKRETLHKGWEKAT